MIKHGIPQMANDVFEPPVSGKIHLSKETNIFDNKGDYIEKDDLLTKKREKIAFDDHNSYESGIKTNESIIGGSKNCIKNFNYCVSGLTHLDNSGSTSLNEIKLNERCKNYMRYLKNEIERHTHHNMISDSNRENFQFKIDTIPSEYHRNEMRLYLNRFRSINYTEYLAMSMNKYL